MSFTKTFFNTENFESLEIDKDIVAYNSIVMDDIIYVFGGNTNGFGYDNDKKIYKYDIFNNSWEQLEDRYMSSKLTGAGTCIYNQEIYFFGGISNTSIRSYNPYMKRWNLKKSNCFSQITTSSKIYAKVFVYDDKAYVLPSAAIESYISDTTKYNLEYYDFKNNAVIKLNNKFSCGTIDFGIYEKDGEKYVWQYRYSYSTSKNYLTIQKYDSDEIVFDNLYENSKYKMNAIVYQKDHKLHMFYIHDSILYCDIIDFYNIDGTETIDDIETLNFGKVECNDFCFTQMLNSNSLNNIDDLFIPVRRTTQNDGTAQYNFSILSFEQLLHTLQEQIIETKDSVQIESISKISNISIIKDMPQNTHIGIAFSKDGRSSYQYYNGGVWNNVSDKNRLISNGEYMTPDEVENLTVDEFKMYFGQVDASTLNILVSLKTDDESISPKIYSIKIMYVTIEE